MAAVLREISKELKEEKKQDEKTIRDLEEIIIEIRKRIDTKKLKIEHYESQISKYIGSLPASRIPELIKYARSLPLPEGYKINKHIWYSRSWGEIALYIEDENEIKTREWMGGINCYADIILEIKFDRENQWYYIPKGKGMGTQTQVKEPEKTFDFEEAKRLVKEALSV
jgi:hypothetical protein